MAELFNKHLKQLDEWLARQPHLSVIYVSYNEVITSPREHAEKINAFLGNVLDVDKMVGVVDQALYRKRVAT
jgi:hypothetical protein